VLQLRGGLMPALFYRVPWLAQLNDSRSGVPYGAAMAPAALIVFPQTAWVAHAIF
jgi:prepilin peptidase CpaA